MKEKLQLYKISKFVLQQVLDVHAYEARQRDYALKGHKHFYFMTLNGNEVIDASAKGNLGRFINHSCDPNCRTEKVNVAILIKGNVPTPKYFNTVRRQTSRPMLKDSCVMPTTDSRLIGTTEKEKESYMNPVSAISKIHTSVEVQDSKGKLPSSVQLENISQQNAMESDLVEKPSSIPRSETASLITESKVLKNSINTNRGSKTERVEGGHGVSRSNLLV
ncbi:hypothetical protein RIF29_09693 [Crotalaria pallida]|uniref:SET domain-containing protein n=1 Tax=Crotalaria pallida TaxID=3830 RepID=A0AAN9ILN6_CROPI